MKPTTIKVDGQDVEVMPFHTDIYDWLARGTKPDRLTAILASWMKNENVRSRMGDAWGVEDLDEGEAGDRIAAALDHFWPGWRDRNPKHAGGTTP